MLESLRARLLLWYTATLAFIIAAFATAVSYAFWRSLIAEVDLELETRAAMVARALVAVGPSTFDLDLPEEALQYFDDATSGEPYYAVWAPDGTLIDRSDPNISLSTPEPGARTRAGRRELIVRTADGTTVLVGRRVSAQQATLWRLAATLTIGGAAALLVSLVGGWVVASRALAPIARISETAAAMSAGALDARIPEDRTETELGQLARILNSAFDRLRDALDRQQRFTADASHELRTPLATLAAELDWALARERSAAEYRQAIETCRRAAGRMERLVEGLLTLARADSGELEPRRLPVALGPLVDEVVTLLRPLAQRRQVALNAADGEATVLGDKTLLHQALANLVQNAVQYNRPGGRVDLAIASDRTWATIRVTDTGWGIAAPDLPRIFDRFYRADPARGGEPGGAGLGLALAKWIVERHGGTITCRSQVGIGTEFLIRLPLSGEGA